MPNSTLTHSVRFRLLVAIQAFLLLVSAIGPIAAFAADPTASPDPSATTVPSAEPTPDPTPEATPAPTPDPTPDPAPDPTPAPTPDPTPAPAPDPMPAPTPDPTPVPAPVATQDYIVTFASGIGGTEQAALLAAVGAEVVDSIPVLRMAAIRVPDGSNVVANLLADPSVSRVELDRVRATEASPSDPRYADQWSLPKIGWDIARDTTVPTGTATVALLDTGVDASHPDLAGQLVDGTSIV
ncbi:MAG TPA: hypothetical protein VEX41_07880, partial [Candidatus Eisenbacteria bacterium]|nr:hypothetical protein [Candidatus Eisenbacteria bacterium]